MGTHNSGQKIPKDDRDAFWYIPWTFKFYYCYNHSNDSKDDRDAFWYILWTPYSMVASGEKHLTSSLHSSILSVSIATFPLQHEYGLC